MTDKKKNGSTVLEFPKKELILPEGYEKVEEIKMPTADDVLRDAVGKFPVVLVIGLDTNGNNVDFATNVPQYTFMQWLMNKASFELNIHERNNNKMIVDVEPEGNA